MPSVNEIVGYDPQKLLPYERKPYELWDADTLMKIMDEPFEEWSKLWTEGMNDEETIDFLVTTNTLAERMAAVMSATVKMSRDFRAFVGTPTGRFREVPMETIFHESDTEILIDVSEYRYGGSIEPRYSIFDVKPKLEEPQFKKNGRSADYLKHDKSKSHRRRK